MGYGGIETWLMHVLRKLDRDRIAIDIVTTKPELGEYAPEAEKLGCKVMPCPVRPQVWTYGRRLGRIVREGAYDVVHSHVYFFSGYILRIAARAGVPVRIAHVHPTVDVKPQTLLRKSYRSLMTDWINRYGNCFIAASRATLDSFWGEARSNGMARHVLYCGIDLKPFTREGSQEQFRRELDLPLGRPVVVNVGRFVPHKNQVALVEIAEGVLRQFPDALFVLAGDGPLLPEVRRAVSEKGLDNSFRFMQGVPDLTPLWKAADVFVFPTLMEGFGIVVVEAAACSLPVVASDIPGVREAALACSAVTLVRPRDVGGFVAATLGYLKAGRPCPPDPQKLVPFSIETSVVALRQIYSESLLALGRTAPETPGLAGSSPPQEREDGGKVGS